jgi:hypothetical protein
MESSRGNTHSVTFFPPGNVFFGSLISTMHPLTTNTAAVFPFQFALIPTSSKPTGREAADCFRWRRGWFWPRPTPYGVGLVRNMVKADRP